MNIGGIKTKNTCNDKKSIFKKIWFYLLILLILLVAVLEIVITGACRITPEQALSCDSIGFVHAVKDFFLENNRLPDDFNEIPKYKYIIQKYSVVIFNFTENNRMTIEIYYPSRMLKSTIMIHIDSGNFFFENTINRTDQ